jgi:hypothetical protein
VFGRNLQWQLVRGSGHPRGMSLVTRMAAFQAEQRREAQWHPQVKIPVGKRAPYVQQPKPDDANPNTAEHGENRSPYRRGNVPNRTSSAPCIKAALKDEGTSCCNASRSAASAGGAEWNDLFTLPFVFGRNLECQTVRRVNSREECYWSHASSFQAEQAWRGIQWHPRVQLSVKTTSTVPTPTRPRLVNLRVSARVGCANAMYSANLAS